MVLWCRSSSAVIVVTSMPLGTTILGQVSGVRGIINPPDLCWSIKEGPLARCHQHPCRTRLANEISGVLDAFEATRVGRQRQHVTCASGNFLGSRTLIYCCSRLQPQSLLSSPDAVQTFQSSFHIVTVKMASDKPLPFAYQFAAGAVAGVSEVGVNDKACQSMQRADRFYSRSL